MKWSFESMHTLRWEAHDVMIQDGSPADENGGVTTEQYHVANGYCRLYDFPVAKLGNERAGMQRGKNLKAVEQVLITFLTSLDAEQHMRHDVRGIRALHSILLACNRESMDLCLKVFHLRPELIELQHSCKSRFYGENSLHSAIVNGGETFASDVLNIGMAMVTKKGESVSNYVMALISQKAQGEVHLKPPACYFGATPLAFACSKQMRRLVCKMLFAVDNEKILSDVNMACPLTGFLPLHAVVASGSSKCQPHIKRACRTLVSRSAAARLTSLRVAPSWQRACTISWSICRSTRCAASRVRRTDAADTSWRTAGLAIRRLR